MPTLNTANYRRDYKGEAITYNDGNTFKSLFVNPRKFPYDRTVTSSIVLGNGHSRLDAQIQLILNQNNKRVAEGYKTTYACNAAYRDTPADYYVIKDRIFFSEIPLEIHNKIFVPNDIWLTYKNTNLLPHVYYMDSGNSAAYLAAFDGAKKVFLFGFDGSDTITNHNIYNNTLGYDRNNFTHENHHFYLSEICRVYNNTHFYRVRTHLSFDFNKQLNQLSNYHEVSIRDAVLEGDF